MIIYHELMWSNSASCIIVLKLQKSALRVTSSVEYRNGCRSFFKTYWNPAYTTNTSSTSWFKLNNIKLFLHSKHIIYCQRTHSNNNIRVNLPFDRIKDGKCFCACLEYYKYLTMKNVRNWFLERPHLLYFHEFRRRWKVPKTRFYKILCTLHVIIEEGPREV